MAKNEVVKKDDQEFGLAIMDLGSDDAAALIRDNLSGGVSAFDLPQIKVPAGGGSAWEVPTLDGTTHAKELSGIILSIGDQRAYWERSLDEGGEGHPDCVSRDGIHGVAAVDDDGHPRGPGGTPEQPRLCSECPMSKFGSGKGNSQACTLKSQIVLLQEEEFLPVIVSIPPTSLRGKHQYLLKLTSARMPAHGVVTTLKLAQAQSNDGVKYSRVEFSCKRKLDETEIEAVKAYRDQIAVALSRS